ncbi:hypothetical protein C8J57DRAFT_1284683 [Mycena rebaudengoi]|nr:hypothetical protein C8J57DRAFT_1284683 [Mycena rebaudengoi]
MPITMLPPELLTAIVRAVPCNHPLDLHRFACVNRQFAAIVEYMWEKAYLAWLGPAPAGAQCKTGRDWRDLTMRSLGQLLNGGDAFVAAEILCEKYRYNRDINYPQPLLVSEVSKFLPTATKQIVIQAIYLTRPLWEAAAAAQGEIYPVKTNRFHDKDETVYYPLEKKGVLPPALPVAPEVCLSVYAPSVSCAQSRNNQHARPFWQSVLPARMLQQERLIGAASFATVGHADTVDVRHFVLPPHHNRYDRAPSYFQIPLARFPESQLKPQRVTVDATRGPGLRTLPVPASGTPAEFVQEVAATAHVPALLLFAHEAADVLDAKEWVDLLSAWRNDSLFGYSLCATHALKLGFDTTRYGAHGVDYILAVRLDTLRAAVTWERAHPSGALNLDILSNQLGISQDEATRMLEIRVRLGGRTGENRPKTGGRSHYPGDALPLVRHWEA